MSALAKFWFAYGAAWAALLAWAYFGGLLAFVISEPIEPLRTDRVAVCAKG